MCYSFNNETLRMRHSDKPVKVKQGICMFGTIAEQKKMTFEALMLNSWVDPRLGHSEGSFLPDPTYDFPSKMTEGKSVI